MLPERCSIREKGLDCRLPPEFIISVKGQEDEYMVGVACEKHKQLFVNKIEELQRASKIPEGQVNFTTIKAVGTNCIKINPSDLIEL